MSDNEDILGDDLGDHTLTDYNLGNDEEDQLLADDYDSGASQNVPPSMGNFAEHHELVSGYDNRNAGYNATVEPYMHPEPECVVPNITVEVPNPTYAPYEPPQHVPQHVPQPMPAAPVELPQIVPSEQIPPNTEAQTGRDHFPAERPPGLRTPQHRDIPDTLDAVVVPRGAYPPRGRMSWRPNMNRFNHPYKKTNVHRGHFLQQNSNFPPPQSSEQIPNQQFRPSPPMFRPERPRFQHRFNHTSYRPRHTFNRPNNPFSLTLPAREINNENIPQVTIRQPVPKTEQNIPRMNPPNLPLVPGNVPKPPGNPLNIPISREYIPGNLPPAPGNVPKPPGNTTNIPMSREYIPGNNVVTETMPIVSGNIAKTSMPPVVMVGREPEVRMLPITLPPNLPGNLPPNLPGKKVLINPHFKGNFQPHVEPGVATYIPTRICKSPPLHAALENKFGNIADIDDAAERFIAEQRSALARAANRNLRRTPPRYIENTRIEIVNDISQSAARGEDELLRRQEEFIQANRQGLRRRMRSPSPVRSPPRRSPSPLNREERRRHRHSDEEYEYRRKLAEQESLRERVLRAKEIRRRKNAIQHHTAKERPRSPVKQAPVEDSKKENKDVSKTEGEDNKVEAKETTSSVSEDVKTLNKEKKEKSPPAREQTPPAAVASGAGEEADGNLTPPLPPVMSHRRESSKRDEEDELLSSEDDLDLILGDIDGILSDEDTESRFKSNDRSTERAKSRTPPPRLDLRSKLPPRNKQKIVFTQPDEEVKREKTPPLRRHLVTSSTENKNKEHKKESKKTDTENTSKRQRIVYDSKDKEPSPPKEKSQATVADKAKSFPNRRVILQRKPTVANASLQKSVFSRIEIKTNADPTKPNPGIFSRAVRTALSGDKNRIVIKKTDDKEPEIAYGSDDEVEKEIINSSEVFVSNLPYGITEARVTSLAGNDLQTILLDKEERSAKITFKNTTSAESFKRKFNNKMVAASRLSVTIL